MISTFLIAHRLGPDKFGSYSLALGIAQLLALLMTLGIQTAITHYLPKSRNNAEIASTGLIVLFASTVCTSSILLVFYYSISKILKIPTPLYIVSIVMALLMAVRYGSDGVLRGSLKFKQAAFFEVASAITGLLLVFILLLSGNGQATLFLYATATIAACYFLFSFYSSRKLFSITHIKKHVAKELFSYGLFTLAISIAQIVLMQADKIILNYFRGSAAVGLYSVYTSSSLLATSFAFTVTNYVLLPTISSAGSISHLLHRIKKHTVFFLFGTALLSFIVSFIYLLLLGKDYAFNWLWLLFSCIYASLYFFANILIVVSFSRGKKEISVLSVYMFSIAAIFVLLTTLLVKSWGVSGMFVSLIVIYSLISVALFRRLRAYYL